MNFLNNIKIYHRFPLFFQFHFFHYNFYLILILQVSMQEHKPIHSWINLNLYFTIKTFYHQIKACFFYLKIKYFLIGYPLYHTPIQFSRFPGPPFGPFRAPVISVNRFMLCHSLPSYPRKNQLCSRHSNLIGYSGAYHSLKSQAF